MWVNNQGKGDKYMYEIHLRQPQFTYSLRGLFTKNIKKIDSNLIANQTRYWQKKVVSFTMNKWNHSYKIIIQKCIQCIRKENLLLLKVLLEP